MKVSLTCWVSKKFSFWISSLILFLSENYFEMSHVDAHEALKIYRHFCKQTDLVVEYLGVARKLQNLLNVPVPHLKHVGALPFFLQPIFNFSLGPDFIGWCIAGIPRRSKLWTKPSWV